MSAAQPAAAAFADAAFPAAVDARLSLIERAPPADFTSWLGALPGAQWPDGRFLAHVRDVGAGLSALFDECETPRDAPARWWIEDAAALAEDFAAAIGEALVDVRLERVSTDACWRFHIDNVPVRLVTTYFGPGTELVPDPFGQEARALQRDYDGPLRRLKAGDVAVFRGGAAGVVHRSPPIARSGESRAVLCLNRRSITSPPLWAPDADD